MDRVIVHCRPDQRTQWAFMLRSLDVPSEIVTPELTDLYPLGISHRSGQATLLPGGGTLMWNQRALQRTFDLADTLPTMPLPATLSEVIDLIVNLDTPGPAPLRPVTNGLGTRTFTSHQFHTTP